jgi:nitrite reductase/ring-hydroxylating ferredoxin subunit
VPVVATSRVLASAELRAGELREVRVGECRVLLGRLRSGEAFAAAPECPHEAAPLVGGTIRGEAVDCPRHHCLFDARTGENLYPVPIYPAWKRAEVGDLTLRVFRCEERGAWIWVELPLEGRAESSS